MYSQLFLLFQDKASFVDGHPKYRQRRENNQENPHKAISEFKKKPIVETSQKTDTENPVAKKSYSSVTLKENEFGAPPNNEEVKSKGNNETIPKLQADIQAENPIVYHISLKTSQEIKNIEIRKNDDPGKIAGKICAEQKIVNEELETAISYTIKKNIDAIALSHIQGRQGGFQYPYNSYYYMGGHVQGNEYPQM